MRRYVITSNNRTIISNELKKIIIDADISICNFEANIKSEGALISIVGLLSINQEML